MVMMFILVAQTKPYVFLNSQILFYLLYCYFLMILRIHPKYEFLSMLKHYAKAHKMLLSAS